MELLWGVSTVEVTLGEYTHTIFTSADPTRGVTPLSLCCNEFREHSLDGSFIITVSSSVPGAELTILIPEDTSRLPVSLYYQLVPVTLSCNGVEVSCNKNKTGCPINVPTTIDPVYSFWSTILKSIIGIIDVVTLDAEKDIISTIVWVSKQNPGSVIHSGIFGAGDQVKSETNSFDFDSCTLSYDNLVDEQGNAVEFKTAEGTVIESDCQIDDYLKYFDAFQGVFTFLEGSQSISISSSQILSVLDMAHLITQSNTWKKCLELAHSFMEKTTEDFVGFTKSCLTPDNDPSYWQDPCCHIELQSTLCCRTQSYTYTATKYTIPEDVNPEEDFSQCHSPNCVLQPLKNLEKISAYDSLEKCSDERRAVEADPKFLKNPFSECVDRVSGVICFFHSVCASINSAAVCDFQNQRCVIPCNDDGSCYNGKCMDGRCMDLSDDEDFKREAIFNCTLDKIDPYLALMVKDEVQNSASEGTIGEKFMNLVTEYQCSSAAGTIIPGHTEETCTGNGICKVMGYQMGATVPSATLSGEYLVLTEDFCKLITLNNDGGFCSYSATDVLSNLLSRPNVCSVRIRDSLWEHADWSEAMCKVFAGGDIWISGDYTGWRPYSSCLMDLNTTEEECLAAPCLGESYKDVPCHSYCRNPDLTSQEDCEASNYAWYQYVDDSDGACVVELDFLTCSGINLEWVAGRDWLPERFNTKETCPETVCWGYSDGTGFKDVPLDECEQYECNSCITGNESSCGSEEACLNSGACDNSEGCVIPNSMISSFFGYDIPACQWNPEYCILQIDRELCLLKSDFGGWWDETTFPTESECLQDAQICNDGSVPDGSAKNVPSLPEGYNLRNKEECEACGGHMDNWRDWGKGKWVSNNVPIKTTWATSAIEKTYWKPAYSADKFATLLDHARVRKFTSILAAELYCTYGIESVLLASVGCACTNSTGNEKCGSDAFLSSPVSVTSFCEGIDVNNKAVYDGVSVTTEDFFIENKDPNELPCMTVTIQIVPRSQFDFQEKGLASSLALVTETQRAKLSSTFVYNDNGVAVGQLMSDGIHLVFNEETKFTGIFVCVNLTKEVEWKLRHEQYSWDIATSSISDFTFIPLGFNLSLSETEACVEVQPEPGVVFFPYWINGELARRFPPHDPQE
eukprot:TRINITY_DN2459_c0_g1_i5.p1 TRINITY_DN2459_c0_g1~~TRINITY_DN2459_c0_g1_i5.p1  ORF type:complete len:1259 (-),score=229.58 TRINITY_DN2459_c0_g1_i5:1204-4620(-)